jgi:hypothetical protein
MPTLRFGVAAAREKLTPFVDVQGSGSTRSTRRSCRTSRSWWGCGHDSLLLLGCSAMQTEGDWFVVRNDGADMPVTVRGDLGADTFVVWLAGGPGDPVGRRPRRRDGPARGRARMVYWDQRGAG